MNLTPKQIQALRIAVAEVDGWENNGRDTFHKNGEARGLVYDPGDGESPWGPWEAIPNYPESLDAVHSVEKLLKLGQYDYNGRMFSHKLNLVCGDDFYEGDGFSPDAIHSTALQRCIALLMTLAPDKWLEIQNLKD